MSNVHKSRLSGPLGGALLLTGLLSAWAYWWPTSQPARAVVQAVQRSEASLREAGERASLEGADTVGKLTAGAAAPLPAVLPDVEIGAASRDPFAPYVPSPPPAPRPPKAVAPVPPPPSPPMAVMPPAATAAPALAYRFLGRFVSPAGQLTVYLEGPGGVPVPVVAGARLDGGYVVTNVADDAIELSYPAIEGYKAKIAVPPRTSALGG